MSETLKPCPFCGDEALMVAQEDGSLFIACRNYCVETAAFDWQYPNAEEELIAIWNRRAGETQPAQEE